MRKVCVVLLFCLLLNIFTVTGYSQSNNLILNPGFEEGTGSTITNWQITNGEPGAVTRAEGNRGMYGVRITHTDDNSYSYVVQVIDVEPNTQYNARVWMRGQDIRMQTGTSLGARLFIGNYPAGTTLKATTSVSGTFDWTIFTTGVFNSGNNTKLNIILYLYKSEGTVWFDDLELLPASEFSEDYVMTERRRNRLESDLRYVQGNLESLEQATEEEQPGLWQEIEDLEEDILAAPLTEAFDYVAGPPYNQLHEQIYALNGQILEQLQPCGRLVLWSKGNWADLHPLEIPAEPISELKVNMMQNEWESASFNITNPTQQPAELTLKVPALTDESSRQYPGERLIVREAVFVEDATQKMLPDALKKATNGTAAGQYLLTVPAGGTLQVWLQFDGKDFYQPGRYKGVLNLSGSGFQTNLKLSLKVWPLAFPEEITQNTINWSYITGSPIISGREEEAVQDLTDHYINTFVLRRVPVNPVVDSQGNITAPIDFTSFDAELDRFEEAKMYLLYPVFEVESARLLKNGFQWLSPEWETMFTQWVQAIVNHMQGKGITKEQFAFYFVDEPSEIGMHTDRLEILLAASEIVKEIDPDILVYTDPRSAYTQETLDEMSESVDIFCPHIQEALPGSEQIQRYQEIERELWLFQCGWQSLTGRQLSPLYDFRLLNWGTWLVNGSGSGFWVYTEVDSNNSNWTDFDGRRPDSSIIYETPEELVPSKRWEAFREGVEDYEYLAMLRQTLSDVEAQCTWTQCPWARKARGFLDNVPMEIFENKDGQALERARLKILSMLADAAE